MATIITNSTTTPLSIIITTVEAMAVKKLWPAILFTSLMMMTSFVGNTVVCYVYGFQWRSKVTKIFIFSLAVLDLTNSLFCMPTEIAMLVNIVSFDAPWWCKISRFLTYMLCGASSLILVAISVDRWYKVCRPLQRFFTHQRAKWTCIGAVVSAASASWPSLVLYGNFTLPILGTEATGVTCLVSDYFMDTWWPFAFYCMHLMWFLCVVVAIIVLYSMIAAKVVHLKKQQMERLAPYLWFTMPTPTENYITSTTTTTAIMTEANSGVKPETDSIKTEDMEHTHPSAVTKLRHLEEEIERRRNFTFRLPRTCNSLEDKVPPRIAVGKNPHDGIQVQTLEIVINQKEEDGRSPDHKGTDPEKGRGKKGDKVFFRREASRSSFSNKCVGLTLQRPDKSDSEFEQGIPITAYSDLTGQHNPIGQPLTVNLPAQVTDDVTVSCSRYVNFDIIRDEMGSNHSLLSGRLRVRATKTWSDSFAILSVPWREAESGKSTIQQSSSDSNLVIREKYQTPRFARGSFLISLEGYLRGHTPKSRLPTPTDYPTPNSPEAKEQPLLSSKLLQERLNDKMAYSPAKTTRMLFVISIVFLISFLPFFCLVLIRSVKGSVFFVSLTDGEILAINIFLRSSFIANAANPIIYGLCNKQFRTQCRFLYEKCFSTVVESTHGVLRLGRNK